MTAKKTAQFQIRIPDTDLVAFKEAAMASGLEPTKCIRDLMAAFATARATHGARLIWPPQFAHFAPESKIIYPSADTQRIALVAEAGVQAPGRAGDPTIPTYTYTPQGDKKRTQKGK